MSKKNPSLQVERDGRLQCQMLLNQDDNKWGQDTWFLGDLVCHEQLLARK